MLQVKKLCEHATLPDRKSEEAAGYDLYAAEDCSVKKNDRCLVKLGISIVVPEGTYGRIAPRSGFSLKKHCTVGAGVIDRDYRGEVQVLLQNLGLEDIEVKCGDRIAQLILEKIECVPVVEVLQELDSTHRGTGGFGSTG